ncbi:secretory phospholipase A2 [Amniculicola lignicola CBS 123094]|uniref:Secretory phospholipase A2 n=1 Tax=Amniculicola lignicola CBS 123094 TaxID=1392246 RepID=A0A6A5WAS6_9PLEO|nr:secretory phospholipase A2 [Amniculicola lignicola CBS 123094]
MRYSIICALGLASTVLAGPLSARETIEETTDNLIFKTSMPDFIKAREAKNPSELNWDADGCSHSPEEPFGFNFKDACNRHDFGYRNTEKQGRRNEELREKLDDQFLKDMTEWCKSGAKGWFGDANACEDTAKVYFEFVREFGKKEMDL